MKAALFSSPGKLLASNSVRLTTSNPVPGRAEQDPADWWAAFVASVVGCRLPGRRAGVLAVTGQMQDLVVVVVVDERGSALGPAMLYSDSRAVAELAELNVELGDSWHRAVSTVPDTSCTAAQLRWLARHQRDVRGRARVLLFGAPGYLVRRAGGGSWCDLTTASTTGLLDIFTHGWWRPVVDSLGLTVDLLPGLVDGVTVCGSLDRGPAEELGLTHGLPIVHVAGDAGAVTGGLVGPSGAVPTISVGTRGWVAALAEAPGEPHPAIHQLVGSAGSGTIRIGALLSAGATVEWARATYLPGADHDAAERAVAQVGPTGLLMLPSLVGERSPVRDPRVSGAVVGLRPTTTGAELYRASMEGVAYALRHIMLLLDARDGAGELPVPVSGGAARSGAFRQILADVLGRPVLPVDAEGAGLHGALRAASTALGEPAPPPLWELADPSTAAARAAGVTATTCCVRRMKGSGPHWARPSRASRNGPATYAAEHGYRCRAVGDAVPCGYGRSERDIRERLREPGGVHTRWRDAGR